MLWKYTVIHQGQFDQAFYSKTELKSEMSGFTEPTQLPTSVKQEIKEEEFDDFLQEYLSTCKTVEEKPVMDCECKTEMNTSPIMTLKEEKYSPMEIKVEEEFDLRENNDFDSSPTSKLLVYCNVLFIFTILEFQRMANLCFTI